MDNICYKCKKNFEGDQKGQITFSSENQILLQFCIICMVEIIKFVSDKHNHIERKNES